ncbi:hypothetical protein AB0C21_14520 [Spirillospora sp. NPDC049024]
MRKWRLTAVYQTVAAIALLVGLGFLVWTLTTFSSLVHNASELGTSAAAIISSIAAWLSARAASRANPSPAPPPETPEQRLWNQLNKNASGLWAASQTLAGHLDFAAQDIWNRRPDEGEVAAMGARMATLVEPITDHVASIQEITNTAGAPAVAMPVLNAARSLHAHAQTAPMLVTSPGDTGSDAHRTRHFERIAAFKVTLETCLGDVAEAMAQPTHPPESAPRRRFRLRR